MLDLLSKLFTVGHIYLGIFIWLFFLAILEAIKEFSRYKTVISASTFLLLAAFTGLRWETGTDWDSYKYLFDTIELDWTFLMNVYSFDIGYVLFNAVIRFFTDNYSVLLIMDSIIAVGIVYAFLAKYSLMPNISFFLFYNSFYVAQFMGSNRRIIALGAMLFVFNFIYERKKKLAGIWQLIAFLFHRTSVMGFVVWLVPKTRFSTKKITVILIIAAIIGLPQLPFKMIELASTLLAGFISNPFIEKLIFYSENSSGLVPETVNPVIMFTLSVLKRSLFLIYYLYTIKKNDNILDPRTDIFFNIYLVGFASYILLNGSPIFQILTTYFTFIEIALIGRMWFYTTAKSRLYLLSIFFFYGFFQLLSALNAFPGLYIPYKSIMSFI